MLIILFAAIGYLIKGGRGAAWAIVGAYAVLTLLALGGCDGTFH